MTTPNEGHQPTQPLAVAPTAELGLAPGRDALSVVTKWALAGHIGELGVTGEACEDIRAAVAAEVAAERERWERALKQSWQAIDPLRPAGQPGSYARGYDNGFAAALEVLRGNLKA